MPWTYKKDNKWINCKHHFKKNGSKKESGLSYIKIEKTKLEWLKMREESKSMLDGFIEDN